jgi:hypothetical protein
MSSTEIAYCPLCGFGPHQDAYASAKELRASFDICECCGCEYGYDDNIEHYRRWQEGGYKWFKQAARPKGWTIESQLRHQLRPWPPEST